MYVDENGLVSFIETPQRVITKEAKLNVVTKTTTLPKFRRFDLAEGAEFRCKM